MIRERRANSILWRNKLPCNWFGTEYLFSVYEGCEHKCIYCDSRSLSCSIKNFDDLIVKINSPELLEKELGDKKERFLIGTGDIYDPYTLSEKKYKLTRKCLEVISCNEYPIHITTKSDLILRDVDILSDINNVYAAVSMSITTYDNYLATKLEPFAPKPDDRFKALERLASLGIKTAINLMPILPFIEDNEDNIKNIISKAAHCGVKYIVPYIGMRLRDEQKEYYYNKLDENFPDLKNKYINKFSNRYNCVPENSQVLVQTLIESCYKYGLSIEMPTYKE